MSLRNNINDMARIYTLGIGRKRVYHLPKKVDKNELKFGTQDSSD